MSSSKIWAGCGKPPVGAIVLATTDEHLNMPVKVLAYGQHGNDAAILVCELDGNGRESTLHGWVYPLVDLRPNLSEEEVAYCKILDTAEALGIARIDADRLARRLARKGWRPRVEVPGA